MNTKTNTNNNQSHKRAGIYIRCSSDDLKKGRNGKEEKEKNQKQRKEGFSPEIQEEKARELIETDGNKLNEECIYKIDLGCSGAAEDRAGLKKLLEDAKNGKLEIVYVYRLDRLSRKLKLLEEILTELTSYGVGFKSVTEPWADYNNPSGKMVIQMLGAVAEWQREITMEAKNEGMIKAMKEGKWLGGTPPYGYKSNRETQKLEIDEKEKPIVEMIFKWLVYDKLSEYKIQKRINEMKIPTKFDRLGYKKKNQIKCWWNKRTIGRILRGPISTGVLYYRKYKRLGSVRTKGNERPREEWIKVEDPNIQIISPELFQRAHEQLKKNRENSPRNTKRIYALQYKIICGFDNYKYQCSARKYKNKNRPGKSKYYFCSKTRASVSPIKCPSSAVSESRILPPIWDKLKELLSDPHKIMREIELYAGRKNNKDKIQEKIKNIEKSIDSYNSERLRWARLCAKEAVTEKEADREIERCKKEIGSLEEKREQQSYLLLAEEEKEKRAKAIEELYSEIKQELNNPNYKTKSEILGWLTEKIVKTGNKLEIEFRLPFNVEDLKLLPLNSSPSFYRDTPRMD